MAVVHLVESTKGVCIAVSVLQWACYPLADLHAVAVTIQDAQASIELSNVRIVTILGQHSTANCHAVTIDPHRS